MSTPALDVRAPAGVVRAVVLVLHGGRETSTEPVRAHQLAVVRMRPFAARLARTADRDGLAVARLRYAVRGWNGAQRAPVADTDAALAQLAGRFGPVPIGLVGHSLGGRTALYTAGHDQIRSVVALAPWTERHDPVEQLRGRHLLVAHGDRDRITNPRSAQAYVTRATAVAASAAFVRVRRETHAMLLRAPVWHALATEFTRAALGLATPARGSVVSAALNGQTALIV